MGNTAAVASAAPTGDPSRPGRLSKTVLRDLKRRGMPAPVVAVRDGALGAAK